MITDYVNNYFTDPVKDLTDVYNADVLKGIISVKNLVSLTQHAEMKL